MDINCYEDIFNVNNKLKIILIDSNGKDECLFLDDFNFKKSVLYPGDIPKHHPDILAIHLRDKYNYLLQDYSFKNICNIYNYLGKMIFFDAFDFAPNSKCNRLGLLMIPDEFNIEHKNYLLNNEEYFRYYYDNILLYFPSKINSSLGICFDDLISNIKQHYK